MNLLANETSPYLLQHAHNPVHWRPWGEAALQLAQAENKLILVSIGYSACHWCHVMERESFENEAIAAIMNENFVCVKVDREERPDVDQLYMDAVQALTGSGGWPLNCFALPDGRPLWGGTYFPTHNWKNILEHLAKSWRENPSRAQEYAQKLTDSIRKNEQLGESAAAAFSIEDAARTYLNFSQHFDLEWGGTGAQPKFPTPVNYRFLLRFARQSGNPQAADFVSLTLDKMAMGGLYDQAGGGFARYSVDRIWHVPHFEKMLYDNAQLVSLYTDAFRATQKPLYQQVVEETLAFVQRELTSAEGLFYSALDADSEGVEGKFYVWTAAELAEVLSNEAPLFNAYYNVAADGNWEHGQNILMRTLPDDEFCRHAQISLPELERLRKDWQKRLLAVRSQRVRPGLDDKILAGWNALMIRGYVDAFRAFGRPEWLQTAQKGMDALLNKLCDGLQLYRTYKNGRAAIPAYLEDYALTIDALLGLYQTTLEEKYLLQAAVFLEHALEQFYDRAAGMFYFTANTDAPLFARKKDIYDTVIPSSNSLMANLLYVFGVLFDKEEYKTIAKRMTASVKNAVVQHAGHFAHWASLMIDLAVPPFEAVVCGPLAKEITAELNRHFLPNALIVGSETASQLPLFAHRFVPNQTFIYVCRNYACQAPVQTVEEALALLAEK